MTNQMSMVIIDSNLDSKTNLENLVEQIPHIKLIGAYDDLLSGYEVVLEQKPEIIYIDLSENTDLAIETIEKITKKNKNTVVFVSAENINTNLVLKAMSAGAREFLTKPVIMSDFASAVKKAKMFLSSAEEGHKSGQIISVFSNKGGIGKTTLATNLALHLADMTEEKVCLIDLNLQLGDITTFLDISPSFDIAYVITHLSRIDESFLLSSLEKYKNKELYVLADPPYVEQAEEISAEDIASLLSFLKEMFGYVVIDTSSSFDIKTLTCLDVSDMILLVSMVNLPSIRNCQRCMDLFERLEYDSDKVKLVINRHIENEEISIYDVEDALGRDVYWKIPNDYFTVMSSINKGVPISVINPDSNINKNISELAAKVSDTMLFNDNISNNKKKQKSFGDMFNNFKLFKK